MHAVIVGGGPAGLATALGLAGKLGFTVDVLEKYPAYAVRGSTLGLQANGIKALRELCSSAKIEELLKSGIEMPGGGVMFAWWNLHDWLLEQVNENAAISLNMGVSLLSIDDETDPFRVLIKCKEKNFQGDLLIAADGVHSQMRSLLGLSPEVSTGRTLWRGSAIADAPPLAQLLEKEFRAVPFETYGLTTFSIFNHHPKLDKRLNWVVGTKCPNVVPGITTPWDLIEAHTRGHELRETFKVILDKSDPQELTDTFRQAVIALPDDDQHGWGGKGRVTFVGDCAHAVRPTAGQGCSLAFEDVVVLCRKLNGKALESRHNVEAVIREFENERLPRVRRIGAEQQRLLDELYRGNVIEKSSSEYLEWLARGV